MSGDLRPQEVVERVLELSQADDCIVMARVSSGANARWANNTATTNGLIETARLSVVSIVDNRVGSVSSTYFPEGRLEAVVRASEAACSQRPEAEDHMPLLAGDAPSPGWEAPPLATGAEALSGFAGGLGEILERADGEGVQLFGYAEHATDTTYLGTSTGLRRQHGQPVGRVEINAKSTDHSLSAWAGEATAGPLDSVDLPALYERLGQRLEWSSTRLDLPPGRYQVLLEPSAVADMLISGYWAGSARWADEGRTVFSRPGGGNRIGDRLYPHGVTIYSDPHEPGLEVTPFVMTLTSSPYESVFDCGLDTDRTTWVDDGVLRALITTRHWAARSGAEQVTPYVENLVFASDSDRDLDDMIAATERALLVTCFWYIREVDPQTLLLTGLTRDGVFLVEDGAVKGAVNNYRYNMSPVRMLAQTSEAGRTQATLAREWGDYFPFAKMPPLRVEDFNMSSVSDAT